MKPILLDIMLDGRFYRQLRYFGFSEDVYDSREISKFVLEKCPSLRGKNYNIKIAEQQVFNN